MRAYQRQRLAQLQQHGTAVVEARMGYPRGALQVLVQIGAKLRDGKYIDEPDLAKLQRAYPNVPPSAILDRVRAVNMAEPGQRFAAFVGEVAGPESVPYAERLVEDFTQAEARIEVEDRLSLRDAQAAKERGQDRIRIDPSTPDPNGIRAKLVEQLLPKGELRPERIVDRMEAAHERLSADSAGAQTRTARETVADALDFHMGEETSKELGLLDETTAGA